jgi:polar amino acid transport system substrate-binding protein
MHWHTLLTFVAIGAAVWPQTTPLAKDGRIRAAYLASNPAQAVKDPTTGQVRGVVVDLARELERLHGVTVTLVPLPTPQAIIDAVRTGEAEIGFVAYNPERAGPVEFSRAYMLVNQTFVVRDDSPIRSIAELDRQGLTLAATRADSIALYLGRTLKQARLVQLDDSRPETVHGMLRAGEIDAFGANRQRLAAMIRDVADVRLLPDDLYGVEQTIIVPGSRLDAQAAANAFIDDVRRSGFLKASIDRSEVVGIAVAP